MTDGRSPAERASATVLAGALVLTSATQLRPGGLPLGPGEVLLSAWIAGAAWLTLARGRIQVTEFTRPFVLFWLVSFAALFLGWVAAIRLGHWTPGMERDAIAFALSAVLTVLLVTRPNARERIVAVAETSLAVFVPAMLVLLAAAYTGRGQIGPIQAMYGVIRFTGWAVNPNQLALGMLLLPVLALVRLRSATSWKRLWYAGLCAGALAVGLATLSDALLLAWVATLLALGGRTWLRRILIAQQSFGARMMAVVIVPVALVIAVVALGPTITRELNAMAELRYAEGGQGSDRIQRWRYGLEAAGASPVVGLGPGAFAGSRAPFSGEEAHNSMIDWLASTGAVGVGALIGLLGWCVVRAFRAGRSEGVVALGALMAFSTFHYSLRQPIFWYSLLAIAVYSDRSTGSVGAPETK